MLFLLLAILAMTAYMTALKLFAVKGVNTAQAIIVNYALASLIAVLRYDGTFSAGAMFANDWWYLSVISGALFFVSMHIMTACTRIAGVSVTTIASRTALIIPVIYSAIFLHEPISAWQAAGVGLVIVALVIIFYSKENPCPSTSRSKATAILMPLGVFFTMGAIAVCMKSAQHIIAANGDYAANYPVFEAMNFITALLCAVVYYSVKEGKKAFVFSWKSVAGGLCIGTFNFLVTFAILQALRTVSTSVFYASYNIAVVVLATAIGWLAFGEKPGRRKAIGITVAIAAIAVLTLLG